MSPESEARQEQGLRYIRESTAKYIIGLDEVGNGAWAGNLTVAGIVFEKDWKHERVKDSKQFHNSSGSTAHEKRTDVLNNVILKSSRGYIIWQYTAKEIDERGLKVALEELFQCTAVDLKCCWPDSVVVTDGDHYPKVEGLVISMPKADVLVPAVSAASILAKVTRDNIMIAADKDFPNYGFCFHMGYGTAKHIAAIKKYGPTPLHRLSYKGIQRVLESQPLPAKADSPLAA